MKQITLLFLFTMLLASCYVKKNKVDGSDTIKKSYKELKDVNLLTGYTEHFDSINNIYSNFKYKVAFNAPNHWSFDAGVSEHTIFRTFQPDSAITFAINVIELNISEIDKAPDIWEMYQVQKDEMDYQFKVLIPKKFNTTIKDFEASKIYIKNKTTLKRQFNYLVREFDFEYSNTSIVYQTFVDNVIYTFSLDVPTMFYDKNPIFYNNLISNISFL